MVAHSYGLVPPTTLRELFIPIEKATDNSFQQFWGEVTSGGGYHDDNLDRCKRIGAALNISAGDAGLLLSLLAGTHDRFRQLEEKGNAFDELFGSFIRDGLELDPEDEAEYSASKPLIDRLAKLFSQNENLDENSKINKLERGFSDQAISFASMVDLRPNFTKDRKRILGYVPIVHLQISTSSEDSSRQQMAIALNAEKLRELQETINDIARKLERLANQEYLVDKIYANARKR
jgi:hypothetical protein